MSLKISDKSIELIKHFESLHDGDKNKPGLQPKLDPVQIWTEGWGRVIIDPKTKKPLKGILNKKRAEELSTIKTLEQADAALKTDLVKYSEMARQKVRTPYWNRLNEDQKGALTAFVYNCGTGATVRYKIFVNIQRWLDKTMTDAQLRAYWEKSVIRAGGVTLNGLIRRRKSEANLFLTGNLYFYL